MVAAGQFASDDLAGGLDGVGLVDPLSPVTDSEHNNFASW